MQLNTTENTVERIGNTGAETQFSIDTNAQAFEILSAGIYTDPIAAVVRELSCNAFDAMVEAGKGDEPFTICLPNNMSPSFSVIDNGIGLSDEDLRGMYTSYFTSTKTKTNDQIGAFGLGSKSPFSYAKAFEVISRFDGEKRTYSIFINEAGVPTMSELANVPTDECNGLEVKLAIRSEDHSSFAETAKTVLQYFPVRPTIKGQSTFQWPTISKTATIAESYTIDSFNGTGLIAIQGNVPYYVNTYQIQSLLSTHCRNFMDRHLVTLRFDIGMLDVAVSREEVRYEDRTKQNIADALQVAFDDYLVQMDNTLSELTKSGSTWEIYTTLKTKFSNRTALQQLVGSNFEFKSKLANAWMESDKVEIDYEWKYHRIVGYGKGDIRAVRQNISKSHHTMGGNCHYTITPSGRTQVILQDVTKRGSLRMNTKLVSSWASAGINSIIAIIPTTDRALTKAGTSATAAQRKAELKEIVKQMGNPTIETLSSWTEDVEPVARAARATGHTFKTIQAQGRGGKKFRKPEFNIAEKPEDGGLYIEIDHQRNTIIKGTKQNISGFDWTNMLTPVLNVINHHQGTDYTIYNVFGLTSKVIKSIANDANWVPLEVAYTEAIAEQLDIIEYYKRIGASTALQLGHNITKSDFVSLVGDLPISSKFRGIMEPIVEISQLAAALSNHPSHPVEQDDFRGPLSNFHGHYDVEIGEVDTSSYFTTDDLAEYSMLKHLSFGYGTDTKDALSYIQLVESV